MFRKKKGQFGPVAKFHKKLNNGMQKFCTEHTRQNNPNVEEHKNTETHQTSIPQNALTKFR